MTKSASKQLRDGRVNTLIIMVPFELYRADVVNGRTSRHSVTMVPVREEVERGADVVS